MSKFKVGDKVRCIDDKGMRSIKAGEVYTIRRDTPHFVYLCETDATYNYQSRRFELVTVTYPNPPHKHAEYIKAWADGAVIEFKDYNETWIECTNNPNWLLNMEYRIKPTTHTITINGKDIELSEERYEALKASLNN